MPVFIDQLGRTLQLKSLPKRIISLVPSQTELLFELGLEKELIGITKFCVHPADWFRSKPKVGGTKNLSMKLIQEFQPDLIIANKEENNKDQVDELSEHYPVWISDIKTLDDALEMIEAIGNITGTINKSKSLITGIKKQFSDLAEQPTTNNKQQTAYLIWRNPYMAAAGDTFIHNMMSRCGLKNIFEADSRYPEITIEGLRNANCELVLLASEPFPFKEKHAEELRSQLISTKIILVDGEMFSWYGSRLLKAPSYFRQLLTQIQ